MAWRITDLSPTLFKVEQTDETDTIVLQTDDFTKQETMVGINRKGMIRIARSTDAQGFVLLAADLVAPTFTDYNDLNTKLQAICFG
jgi:hypothetical protein